MNESNEKSPSGAPIYRHKTKDRPVELISNRSAFADRIEDHLEKYIGKSPNVLHEIVSDRIHLDVHVVPPTNERQYFVLYTTGMSTRQMNTPPNIPVPQFAELLMALPTDWPGLDNILRDTQDPKHPWRQEENYWPIRLLKSLARLPHEYDTWLGYGHTINAGEGKEPFASNTKLCTSIIALPEGFLPVEAALLPLDDQMKAMFYAVIPLYPEERDFKMKQGADALFDLLEKEGIGPVIDPKRPNVCAKRKRWFFF